MKSAKPIWMTASSSHHEGLGEAIHSTRPWIPLIVKVILVALILAMAAWYVSSTIMTSSNEVSGGQPAYIYGAAVNPLDPAGIVGQKAPLIEGYNSTGRPVLIDRGSAWMVAMVFPNDTGAAQVEALRAWNAPVGTETLLIIPPGSSDWMRAQGWRGAVVVDYEWAIAEAFAVDRFPTLIGLDANGYIASYSDGSIVESFELTDAASRSVSGVGAAPRG